MSDYVQSLRLNATVLFVALHNVVFYIGTGGMALAGKALFDASAAASALEACHMVALPRRPAPTGSGVGLAV
jgi:hypothetical protein